MNNKPIGIFDSGLGGMTAARALEKLLPNENIIYFGDSGRMPYGGRSLDEIKRFAHSDTRFMESFGVKAILVACGTISSNALGELIDSYNIPFFGVVDPACRAAARESRGRIGVIATQASIKSGMYEKGIKSIKPELEVVARACPELTPLVESGHFLPGDKLAEEAVRRSLAGIKAAELDTLILGCTHFPLLEDIISEYLGKNVRLISCGAEAAKELAAYLREKNMLASDKKGERRYFTSGDTETFGRLGAYFMGHEVKPERYIPEA